MLARLRDALQRRHAVVVDAEVVVGQRGARGAALAHAAAEDTNQTKDGRAHYRLVAAVAEGHLAELDGLDTASPCELGERWAQRRGSWLL
jgi:hypothetical protein